MFSAEDRQKIREAVAAAEKRTRGEIVPMVVPVSGRYEAPPLFGALLALLTLAGMLMLEREGWGFSYSPAVVLLTVVLSYALGNVMGSFPIILRWLTPNDHMDLQVRRRAEAAFYEHGLHKTREASGVLIMISQLEHRVQILADRAIDEKVPPRTWNVVVDQLVQDLKAGRPTDGLCHAIKQCGELLAVHFPARPADNPDELSDDLVQGSR
jgi:putative membrane protein